MPPPWFRSTLVCVSYLQRNTLANSSDQQLVVIPTCADLTRFQLAEPVPASPSSNWLYRHCAQRLVFDRLASGFWDAVDRVVPNAVFELISRDSQQHILAELQPSPTWSSRLRIQSASSDDMPAILQRHSASVMFFSGGLSKLGSSPTRMASTWLWTPSNC